MTPFRDERSAAEFVDAWLAAAAEATGDFWSVRKNANGSWDVIQEFRSAMGDPDPRRVHGAIYCSGLAPESTLAERLFGYMSEGDWPLQHMKGCGSPEEAMLRLAARGVVP